MAAAVAPPSGFYGLRPGTAQTIGRVVMENPLIVGQTIRTPWNKIQPNRGQFLYNKAIDRSVDECERQNKKFKLLVQTGRDLAPTWIKGQWGSSEGKRAPVPWNTEMLGYYEDLVDNMASVYAGHPLLSGFYVTGPTWPSAEMHPMPGLRNQGGYSTTKVTNAWVRVLDPRGQTS